jgi:uncharacterized protein (TIGR00645 family)
VRRKHPVNPEHRHVPGSVKDEPVVLAFLENLTERLIFSGRWLLAPMYVGLLLSLVGLLLHFVHDFLNLFSDIYNATPQEVALRVLALLDTTLLGNLVVLMIFSGYENFVSKINIASEAEDRPSWMGKVDYSGLKVKLIGSLVAISVIELLKDFVEAHHAIDVTAVKWRIAIHLTFVLSGLLFAVMDYISDKRVIMDTKTEIRQIDPE